MEKRNILIAILIVLLVIAVSFLTITGGVFWEKAKGKIKIKPQCNDGIDNDGDGYCDFAWKKAKCTDGSIVGDLDCSNKMDNDEAGGEFTCAQQSGDICLATEYCPGTVLTATDSDKCCSETCKDVICSTCDTCGDGLFNICDRAECYSCTVDNCYFIDNLFVDECNSCSGATCESYGDDSQTCSDDSCGLGSCVWSGSLCLTQIESQVESQVTRGFSSTIVSEGEIVSVTLDILIREGETYYVIEEYIPLGWAVIDDGGGVTTDPYILKWAVIQDTVNTAYTYTVQAPASTGDYIFDGVYMFEGFANTVSTQGETIVNVGS